MGIDNALDWDLRSQWDKNVYGMKVFEESKEYRRMYHCFKAPVVSDRDMHLEISYKIDFPRQGDFCSVTRSVVDLQECPEVKGKVRATVHENYQVLTPTTDPKTGEEYTEMFSSNSTDIAGSVPKWVIKNIGKNTLKNYAKNQEKACIAYHKKAKGK